jgi:hypothetical protein
MNLDLDLACGEAGQFGREDERVGVSYRSTDGIHVLTPQLVSSSLPPRKT